MPYSVTLYIYFDAGMELPKFLCPQCLKPVRKVHYTTLSNFENKHHWLLRFRADLVMFREGTGSEACGVQLRKALASMEEECKHLRDAKGHWLLMGT